MSWYKKSQNVTNILDLLEEGVYDIPSDEVLYDYVSKEDLEKPLKIKMISEEEAKNLLAHSGDMTVLDSYQFASDESKELIEYYSRIKPFNDVIVLKSNIVLDGNHRVVASILGGWQLRAVDIDELTWE